MLLDFVYREPRKSRVILIIDLEVDEHTGIRSSIFTFV